MMKEKDRDLAVRLRLLDLACEIAPLERYDEWVRETLQAAREVGDQQKIAYYERLLVAVEVDMKKVVKEMIPIWNASELGTPLSALSSDDKTEEGAANSGDNAETLSLSSTTSYITARSDDDHLTHNNEDVVNLMDLELSPEIGALDPTSDMKRLLQSTGIAEMSEVDRLLS